MSGVGAAFGLKILLSNLESLAQGAKSPPRYLMMHWPVGTLRARYLPTGGNGTGYVTSPILQPFETAGLRDDMIVLYGFSDGENPGGGGGHEAGTPMTTTGSNCPGTRRNGGEADDACAGGPSFDQIFLKNVPDLQRPGVGYANSICDSRVDSLETSTQCLSYSYTTRSVVANSGANITEAVPLLPELSPAQQYIKLFSGFMPGGATTGNMDTLSKALRMRKSVLDYAMGELSAIKTLAPGSEAAKIDLHTDAIRKVELQLSDQIAAAANGAGGGTGTSASCTVPSAPDASLKGKSGSHEDYDNPTTSIADDVQHEQIGKVHASIIRAAFVCDILRVATFQWSPGTNHVSFKGQYPGEPNTIYMHHPLSHRSAIQDPSVTNGSPPSSGEAQALYVFLQNIQTWYNQKTADILTEFKNAKDAFGNSLLDYTIVPFVTEVAETAHTRGPKPALIFGGKALGMKGGQFQNLNQRPQQDLFATIAQAYFGNTTPLTSNLSAEKFVKTGVSVIPGLWTKPT
jgi:hypothetical protein